MKEKIKKILKIMLKKNIKLFLRKHILFFIPVFLLILYFLYPIPVATFRGVSQAIDEKKDAEAIITNYEEQKSLYKDISPEEAKKQWMDKCIADCLRTEPRSPTGSFSPDEICNLRCQSRLIMVEGEMYFKISAEKIEELKNISFGELLSKNFNKNITGLYRSLIKNFHFQNIVIILLGLIVYYGIIFGTIITRQLEKQK